MAVLRKPGKKVKKNNKINRFIRVKLVEKMINNKMKIFIPQIIFMV